MHRWGINLPLRQVRLRQRGRLLRPRVLPLRGRRSFPRPSQAQQQGKSSIAHKGMLAAAKVMAYVGAELLLNPELIEKAKADWKEELDGETYPNPLPADLKPSIW